MKIVFDTNFCTIPFQFKIDIYDALDNLIINKYELEIPDICIEELKKLRFGKVAIELLKKKNVKIVPVERKKDVDFSIIQYAKKEGAIIATQDIRIKKDAKSEGIPTITMRQKRYLIFNQNAIKPKT
jgi:rRNA-processing protein FCF1